jgi:hypothetical protein
MRRRFRGLDATSLAVTADRSWAVPATVANRHIAELEETVLLGEGR